MKNEQGGILASSGEAVYTSFYPVTWAPGVDLALEAQIQLSPLLEEI